MGSLALLEVLDRDGHVRHQVAATRWPLSVGRAIDNDLVLDDPHVAPHHFSVNVDDEGQVFVTVGDTVNGLQVGRQRLARDSRVPVGGETLPLVAGRTPLRLRLAGHQVAAEMPMAVTRSLLVELSSVVILLVVVAAMIAFDTYLSAEPALLTRELGREAIKSIGLGLVWCGFMSVLSKVFTRQASFGWHLRVMLGAVAAWKLIGAVTGALAFVFSWPWISDYAFVATCAVAGVALYVHMLAIEPRHPARWRVVGGSAALTAVALTLWFNHQATDRFGDELYMSHLLPPSLRLARPVSTDTFLQSVAPLQKTLQEKAAELDEGDDADADAPLIEEE